MRVYARHASPVALALLLAACGDPVAEGSYAGEPLFRLQGRIEGDAGTSTLHAPYLGLIWFGATSEWDEVTPRYATALVPVRSAAFPGRFELDMFDPPPDLGGGAFLGSRMVLGGVVAFDDVDGDGKFEFDPSGHIRPPDLFFGISMEMLVWIEEMGNPICLGALFGNPGEARPRTPILAAFDPCAGYELLPDDTMIRLVLFSPRSQLPEEPPGQVSEPECEGEVYPDCAANPDHPICQFDALYNDCIARACAAETAARQACLRERCADDPTVDCEYTACAAEVSAVLLCEESSPCSMDEVCRG